MLAVMEEYGTSSVATTKDSRAESNNASVVDLTRCAHVERTAEEERLAQLERENRELKRYASICGPSCFAICNAHLCISISISPAPLWCWCLGKYDDEFYLSI